MRTRIFSGHVYNCNPGLNFAEEVQSVKTVKFYTPQEFVPLWYKWSLITGTLCELMHPPLWSDWCQCGCIDVAYGVVIISRQTCWVLHDSRVQHPLEIIVLIVSRKSGGPSWRSIHEFGIGYITMLPESVKWGEENAFNTEKKGELSMVGKGKHRRQSFWWVWRTLLPCLHKVLCYELTTTVNKWYMCI